jgi:uncharacterized membrane-anchored protein
LIGTGAVGKAAKVEAVTLSLWIFNILTPTLEETTLDIGEAGFNGSLVGTLNFGALLAGLVWLQMRGRWFDP